MSASPDVVTTTDLMMWISAYSGLVLSGVTVAFAVVSAYIAALYLVVYQMDLWGRVFCFAMFTGALVVLALFMWDTHADLEAVREIVRASGRHGPFELAVLSSDDGLFPASVLLGAIVWFALGCLTLFTSWRAGLRSP